MKKLLVYFLFSFLCFACVDQSFDEPPAEQIDNSIKANGTIKDLKKILVLDQYTKITTDLIIEAIVVANDESGNFYKQLVVQDATGGIDIRINATSLFNEYPVGRKIFIKCKDLYISEYNNQPQLGSGIGKDANGLNVLASIEPAFLPDYITKGEKDQKITPRIVTLAELNSDLLSTLITIKDVQFADGSTGVTYADSKNKKTLNQTIEDCNKLKITLRNSGYASFANELTPTGKGSITAVYSIFGTTNQLFIRNTNDVSMTDVRCNGSTGGGGTGGPVTGTEVPIGDLRKAWAAGQTTTAANTKIKGTVISDKDTKNIAVASCVVQGADGKGITVRFTGAHSFALGDVIEVATNSAVLSEFNGLLQVAGGSASSASKVGTGTVTPNKLTLAQIEADFENLESTLVQVVDAKASTTAKYSGSINLSDASNGKIVLYTATAATFASDALPGDVITLNAIVGQFNTTKQLQIRKASDVVKGNGSGGTGGTGGTGTETELPVSDVRKAWAAGKTTLAANTKIKATVISDKDNKNVPVASCIVQGADGQGITLRFTGAAHTFVVGDVLEIITSNAVLSEFNGLLQLAAGAATNAKKVGNAPVTPKELTIAQILADFENLESTLVTVKNATFPAATKYGGSIKLNDGTGEIDLYTNATATFTNIVPPVGTKTVTAVVGQFKAAATIGIGAQLQIRAESDIK
jgi:hypothetical protein